MIRKTGNLLGSALLLLMMLAGCGSAGLDDILGGGGSTPSASGELRGTVSRVDTSSRAIVLSDVEQAATYLRSGETQAVVYYDDRTVVEYQGSTYRPADLEAGDRIAASVDRVGDRLVADRVSVLYDVSGGSGYPGSTYGNTLRGTVSYVDPRARILEIDRGGYGTRSDIVRVQYDTGTTVEFEGRRYQPEDLERGDVVEMNVRDLGSGRLAAERIYVVQSVSGGGAGQGSYGQPDVTGAVRYVDTRNRTIELERTTWGSRFSTGGAGSTTVLQYDGSTVVEFQGRTYSPANLERGDIIEAQVRNLGSSLLAERIVVVRDVGAVR